MIDDKVVAKFKRRAPAIINDATAEQILDRAWTLDKLDNVTPLFAFKTLK